MFPRSSQTASVNPTCSSTASPPPPCLVCHSSVHPFSSIAATLPEPGKKLPVVSEVCRAWTGIQTYLLNEWVNDLVLEFFPKACPLGFQIFLNPALQTSLKNWSLLVILALASESSSHVLCGSFQGSTSLSVSSHLKFPHSASLSLVGCPPEESQFPPEAAGWVW